jgi:cephalosporin hydroxylase
MLSGKKLKTDHFQREIHDLKSELSYLNELLLAKDQHILKMEMLSKLSGEGKTVFERKKDKKTNKETKEHEMITWATPLIGKVRSSSTEIMAMRSIDDLQKAFLKEHNSLSPVAKKSDTIYGNLTVKSQGKEFTVDEIVFGYQSIFEKAALFTYTNFLGVSLQQDPSDAFALMDLIWRLKPDLLIELGTAGGGSAFFYAMIMTAYNPNAHVITMDPKRLEDWNKINVQKVCPHCISGRDTPLWDTDTIHFFPMLPTDPNTTALVDQCIEKWKPKVILVMDDSNHLTDIVKGNIETYAKYVTPGSYLIIQDMKMERLYLNPSTSPPKAVREFLLTPIGQEFEVDRTFEYYFYTQHAKGFLKRKKNL